MSVQTMGELFNLSANIRGLRLQNGWSVRGLADRLDTSHPTVIRWEQPVPTMNLESLVKIADVFGVSIAELFMEQKVGKHE